MRHLLLIMFIVSAIFLSSCETIELGNVLRVESDSKRELVVKGLKEALRVGATNAVRKLSQNGGFSNFPKRRIGLPEELKPVADSLKRVGLGGMITEFENRMNKAAEKATSQAVPIFTSALTKMSFDDAMRILHGEGSPATDYFRKKTSGELGAAFKPVIKKEMEKTGVYSIYNSIVSKYDMIPFKKKPKFDLEDYITAKTLNSLFDSVAVEERLIRENPSARTSELLRKVFGEMK